MRYAINFDKTVNQLVPYYLGGRKLILYLQALTKPLQKLNDAFTEWAKETRIEASMTSQIFKLEWYLNRKLSKYFNDPTQKINIQNTKRYGVAIYQQGNTEDIDSENFILYQQSESSAIPIAVPYSYESLTNFQCSFTVNCPPLRKGSSSGILLPGINEKDFVVLLSSYINKYKIANKTYQIKINK